MWEFSQWMSAWWAQWTVGQLGPSQVPAVVELLFPGSESCVIGWVLSLSLQGSTWSRECTLTFSEGFSWDEAGDTFWQCLALFF